MEDYRGEERDEFMDFYKQFRPGPASEHSSRSSAPRSLYGSNGSGSEYGTASSSLYGGSVRDSSMVLPRHKKLFVKSKSLGRDPRLVDMHNTYRRQEQEETNYSAYPTNTGGTSSSTYPSTTGTLWERMYPSSTGFPSAESRLEDTLSRDSGNSSGGTPEAGRKGTIIRHNSYPSPFMNSSAVQTFTEDHCDRKPYDTVSLTTGGPKYSDDSLSVRSLDSNSKTWSPLSEEMRPHFLRRNCVSSEARSLEPTEPEPNSTESNYQIEKLGLVGRVLRRILKLIFLLLLFSVIFFSFILILEIVKSYKCMSQGRLLIDTDELSVKLKQNLFGQHIAQQEIVSAIDSFINEPSDSGGKPLLVLILTGWLGSGKTYSSSLISSVFPVPGNIHSIIGTYLSSSSLTDVLKIISRSCGYNLLILDDVDGGEEVGLRKLETLLVSLASEVEAQNNGTLVLLTTNIGGHSINRYMLEKAKEGLSTLDTVDGDSIRKHLQEDKVSLPLQAFLSEYNIPVHVIPFLPLTRDHVRSCIHAELRRNSMNMSKDDINKVLDQVQFFNKEFPIFAKTGCKKIMSKVNIALNGHLDL